MSREIEKIVASIEFIEMLQYEFNLQISILLKMQEAVPIETAP